MRLEKKGGCISLLFGRQLKREFKRFSILPYMVGMLFAWALAGQRYNGGYRRPDRQGPCSAGVPEGLSMMLLLRPLSGSAALAELDQIYAIYGPDSLQGRLASVLMGSTETIMYTIPVYLAPPE